MRIKIAESPENSTRLFAKYVAWLEKKAVLKPIPLGLDAFYPCFPGVYTQGIPMYVHPLNMQKHHKDRYDKRCNQNPED